MTASEFYYALRHSAQQIWELKDVCFTTKACLLGLKVVAVTGYHCGRAYTSPQPRIALPKVQTRIERASTLTRLPKNGSLRPSLPVAVIIPCLVKDKAGLSVLRQNVKALRANTRPPDLICIVDDCSPLQLAADEELAPGSEVGLTKDKSCLEAIPAIREMSILKPIWLLVLRVEPNTGPALARNMGLVACRERGAEVICFTDADCLPSRTWLAEMLAAQKLSPGIVCGRTLSTRPDTAVGLYHDLFGTLNGRQLPDGSLLYGCTCNFSICAASFPPSFAFDTSFAEAAFEDVEFCVRARKQDVPLVYCGDALVRHEYETTVWGLFKQFQRYGSSEPNMCRLHPEYLAWLWASKEIPSSLPLPPLRGVIQSPCDLGLPEHEALD